jgi:hypothetical protein
MGSSRQQLAGGDLLDELIVCAPRGSRPGLATTNLQYFSVYRPTQSFAGVDDQRQSGPVVLAEKLMLHQADVRGVMVARVALHEASTVSPLPENV